MMAWHYPSVDPVALALGPIQIRWYALAYLAGIFLGWAYGAFYARKNEESGVRPDRRDIEDFIPFVVLGIICGGRLGYVLFYQPSYYLSHPLEILKLWEGGMSFHGGVLGMIVSMTVYSMLRKIPLLRLSDIFCAAAPMGIFFGRLANFVNGELYGRVTNSPLGMVFPHAGEAPRHPSQLYEAGLEGLLLFSVLAIMIRFEAVRRRSGVLTGAFLIGYALSRLFVENFREPDTYLGFVWMDFTMGQVLCFPMLVLGACVLGYALLKPKC